MCGCVFDVRYGLETNGSLKMASDQVEEKSEALCAGLGLSRIMLSETVCIVNLRSLVVKLSCGLSL